MHEDYERCLAVILERDELMAKRIERLDVMSVLLDPELPLVWDANYVRLDRPGIAPEAIVAAADDWIGGAGMAHRTVAALDAEDAERLATELKPRGWKFERYVCMAHRRDPDREADAPVEEVSQAAVDDARRQFLREDLVKWVGAEHVNAETVEQLLAWDRTIGAVAGDRWFIARVDGEVASFCRLLVGGGTGQVEDVATMSWARGRGLARAVVLAAVKASRADGNELTFIGADIDDWPQHLYRRLGFEPIGAEATFYLLPPPAA